MKQKRGRPKVADKLKMIPVTVAMTPSFKLWLDREAWKQKKSRFEVIEDAFNEKTN